MTRTTLPRPRNTASRRAVIRAAITAQLDVAGRFGLDLATINRGVRLTGLDPSPAEMRAALDFLRECKEVVLTASGRYRATVTTREVKTTLLAFELCQESVSRGRPLEWKRCQRNARARLSRAEKRSVTTERSGS